MTQSTAFSSKHHTRGNGIPENEVATPSGERMRILFFACSPADAQLAFIGGDRVEIAYLPSHDMQEILNEIERFSPSLVACQSSFLITSIRLSSEPRPANSKHQSITTLPNQAKLNAISPREAKIVSMLVQGKTNNEIAAQLKLSPRTVKRTLSDLFENFRVSNRTELSNLMGRLHLAIQKE